MIAVTTRRLDTTVVSKAERAFLRTQLYAALWVEFTPPDASAHMPPVDLLLQAPHELQPSE